MLSRFLTFLLAFALALPATSQESDESEELDLAQSACVALDHVGCLAHTRALLDADPFAAELPLLRSMRVAAHLALEQPAEALVELETLVSERRGGWSLVHVGDEALLAEADRLIQERMLELARGEYAAGRFEEAYGCAVEAADARPGTLHCRLACELAIHITRRMGRAGHDGDWTLRQLDSLDRFILVFTDDFVTQDILLESGQLLYELDRHEEAIPRLQQVVRMAPDTPAAADAASVLLRSLQARRDWAGLAETAEMLLAIEGFDSPELRGDVAAARERASFHLIEAQHVRIEDWQGAAEAFQAFSEQFPDSDLADRALYNAIVFYYKAGRTGTASHLAKVLRRKFPHSPYINRLQL